jgi:hypothetical protein
VAETAETQAAEQIDEQAQLESAQLATSIVFTAVCEIIPGGES